MNEHPPADVVLEYWQGSLAPAAAEAVRTHLTACPECQAVLQDIGRFTGMLREQPRSEPSKRADERVQQMIRRAARPARRLATWRRLGAVAAGTVVGGLEAPCGRPGPRGRTTAQAPPPTSG